MLCREILKGEASDNLGVPPTVARVYVDVKQLSSTSFSYQQHFVGLVVAGVTDVGKETIRINVSDNLHDPDRVYTNSPRIMIFRFVRH